MTTLAGSKLLELEAEDLHSLRVHLLGETFGKGGVVVAFVEV